MGRARSQERELGEKRVDLIRAPVLKFDGKHRKISGQASESGPKPGQRGHPRTVPMLIPLSKAPAQTVPSCPGCDLMIRKKRKKRSELLTSLMMLSCLRTSKSTLRTKLTSRRRHHWRRCPGPDCCLASREFGPLRPAACVHPPVPCLPPAPRPR